MSNDYTLEFDLTSYNTLEAFGRVANKKENLGDKGEWLTEFLWGMDGLRARLLGVQIHYYQIHSWELIESLVLATTSYSALESSIYQMTEYHFSTILFNMDSAIECLIFTLNALGYAANPDKFKNVTDKNELSQIALWNVFGRRNEIELVKGYNKYFPTFKKYWIQNRNLLDKISEQHDVSKHRSTIFEGGTRRTDAPPRFFNKFGIEEDEGKQIPISAWAEIPLTPQPKLPRRQRKHVEYKHVDKLEDIAKKFERFINVSGVKALEDAKKTIILN